MILVRGSRTCSFVARSDLSFAFAYELGPFLLTPTPMIYGTSIFAIRDEYFASAPSWSVVLSFGCELGPAVEDTIPLRGWLIAGRGATELERLMEEMIPCAFPVRTATCCRRRLYCLVKSARPCVRLLMSVRLTGQTDLLQQFPNLHLLLDYCRMLRLFHYHPLLRSQTSGQVQSQSCRCKGDLSGG